MSSFPYFSCINVSCVVSITRLQQTRIVGSKEDRFRSSSEINKNSLKQKAYPLFAAYEVPQVPVLHVGQHHQGEPFLRQQDAQQRQHVGVVEALHDDALL